MRKSAHQPRRAVIYARVSSKEQEREGFSISARLKPLNSYYKDNSFHVEKESVDVETAKRSGRTNSSEMMGFLRKAGKSPPDQRPVVLVEKTDRLYRKRIDLLAVTNQAYPAEKDTSSSENGLFDFWLPFVNSFRNDLPTLPLEVLGTMASQILPITFV